MKQGKVWGKTESLLVTPMIEVHRINVEPGMKCSIHKHEHKWNMFYCISGAIDIHVQKNDYDLTDVTTLKSGEYTTVPPGEWHWFETNTMGAWEVRKQTEVLEIYYLEPISSDIIRKTVGGIVE